MADPVPDYLTATHPSESNEWGSRAKPGDLLRLSSGEFTLALEVNQRIDWLGREAVVVFLDREKSECVVRFTVLPGNADEMADAFGRAKYERTQALLRDGVALFDEVVTRDGDMYPEMADWCDRARKEMP